MALAIDPAGLPAPLLPIIAALCDVSIDLADRIALGPLAGDLAAAVGVNADGDGQKALDVIADEAFARVLGPAGVRHYASEEREEIVTLNDGGSYALAIDPLDGSSNIDVNVSIGTIFSIYPAEATAEASLLRPARDQLAAGYVIYGPQTGLMLTCGAGTRFYILDRRTRVFRPETDGPLRISDKSREFAINASNYRHWSDPVRAYIDDCLAGTEGPRARNYNMRWVASLVAETHRILTRGGIFLYPADTRPGYEQGRLRLVYEAAPIAFLVEQAGGRATDGMDPIMGRQAVALHERTPLVFGSSAKVDQVAVYHDLPPAEVSALFGERGLFRS